MAEEDLEEIHNILYNDIDDNDFDVEETTFDRTLAAQHDYLGSNWEEVRGRTLYEESSIVSLPILCERGIILFPGQTLPLTVLYPSTIAMLRKVVEKDKTFGVICLRDVPFIDMNTTGTTAEIFQYIDGSGLDYFKLKAKGRQRFEVLGVTNLTSRTMIANVRILPEINLPNIFTETRLPSLKRYSKCKKRSKTLALMDNASMSWPNAAFQNYNIEHVTRIIVKELVAMKLIPSEENAPSDPTHLSYFAIQCYPFTECRRQHLLRRDTALERLQVTLQMLEENHKTKPPEHKHFIMIWSGLPNVLQLLNCSLIFKREGKTSIGETKAKENIMNCRNCSKALARQRDMFSMSVEGPTATYCNPGGHLHQVITVHQATGLLLEGQQPSTEYSWFPGYGWTVAHCSSCWWHVGWLFTAMSADLHPQRFWGLTKRSIKFRVD